MHMRKCKLAFILPFVQRSWANYNTRRVLFIFLLILTFVLLYTGQVDGENT